MAAPNVVHPPKTKLTADEFWELYGDQDGSFVELVSGDVIEMAPPGEEHGVVSTNIVLSVGAFVRERNLGRVYSGDTGFVLDPAGTVRGPDVAFVSSERLAGRPITRKWVPGAPDLAIEIVSPSDSAEDIEDKIHDYFQAGTREVWYLYPARRTVHVYSSPTEVKILAESDTLGGGDVIPGFATPVAALFE